MSSLASLSLPVFPAAAIARLIAAEGPGECIAGIARHLDADFRRWPQFDKSPRAACHSPEGVIELMPVSDGVHYSFKYVNGHPKNQRHGLPTVLAFGVLAEVATGLPCLLAELTLLTALRTAAMSALAAQHLARPDSRRLALIGNGAQSEFQALAFHRLLGIREFHLHDLDPAATAKLQRNLARLGLSSRAFASTAEAVRGCDIVTTITADKSNATILTPAMIEPGMHLNAVGGDCPGKTELAPEILAACGQVFVEYAPQTRIEGELQQMPADFPAHEFWQVLSGAHPGRQAAEEVTIFDSVGFALEDFSALRWLQETAAGQGETLGLLPQLADPRDLFGYLPLTAGLARAA